MRSEHWLTALLLTVSLTGHTGSLLVLDEVQKVSGWSEVVKRLWDQDSATGLASAVGAHLINASLEHHFELFYWRDRNREVDFVVRHHGRLIAIEVKSGRHPVALPGMEAFAKAFNPDGVMLVGGDGISVETFLTMNPQQWLTA